MSINSKVINNSSDWNSEKRIELSKSLGDAYNPGLDNAKSDRALDSHYMRSGIPWDNGPNTAPDPSMGEIQTTDRLRNALSRKADFWTVDKLISMSRNLSSAYGVDY